ncbi:MAG: CheB methylesterase [Verrucomicrobiaceae bacterium]|nr:CheB methylesterase [Verrucomicrobiaceae bacterium]
MAADLLRRSIDAIVIGASSGGVEAISALLPALTETMRVSIFIVLHVPRDRPSGLVELFNYKCVLPVREAQDKEPVENGTVYIAPPDYHLLLDKGPRLALSCDEPVHYSRPAIDCLFESAADIYQNRLLGIILTGGNEDGAAGLAAVKNAGGVTIVQQPDTAQMSVMPAAALKRCTPDFVLPLVDIVKFFTDLKNGF